MVDQLEQLRTRLAEILPTIEVARKNTMDLRRRYVAARSLDDHRDYEQLIDMRRHYVSQWETAKRRQSMEMEDIIGGEGLSIRLRDSAFVWLSPNQTPIYGIGELVQAFKLAEVASRSASLTNRQVMQQITLVQPRDGVMETFNCEIQLPPPLDASDCPGRLTTSLGHAIRLGQRHVDLTYADFYQGSYRDRYVEAGFAERMPAGTEWTFDLFCEVDADWSLPARGETQCQITWEYEPL